MNIENLNNLVNDINDTLKTSHKVSRIDGSPKNFISLHKRSEVKDGCVKKIIPYLNSLLDKIKEKQGKYDENYKKGLKDRQEYAETQIKAIKTKMETNVDKIKVEEAKNIISKIDYIKMYNCEPIKPIRVDKYNSIKIFLYLDSLNLGEKYKYMNEYLNKKIIFETMSPSDLEIKNLKKMCDIIENHI